MRGGALTGGVLVVVGTRPEVLKMAPVVAALRRRGLPCTLCLTGQHGALVERALDDAALVPDVRLPRVRPGTDLADLTSAVMRGVRDVIGQRRPAVVLVHGDTASALGAALAASFAGVPVGHVEAGLRSGDPASPFPEELNRGLVDRMASLWFAPTERAAANLRREGAASDRVFVCGNTVVDALSEARRRAAGLPWRTWEELGAAREVVEGGGPLALVTAHRRESIGSPLLRICEVVAGLAASGLPALVPLHPNPAVRGTVVARLGEVPGVFLLPPLPYLLFVRLLERAAVVLTDSGGVQEEAAALGRPTLVLRDLTERPEVLETGVVRVVGTEVREVAEAVAGVLAAPPTPSGATPLGDGRAAERIVDALARVVGPGASRYGEPSRRPG